MWSGHLPITQQRLLSIMGRAEAGVHDFALVERSLFVICEFWAAVVARDLHAHLRSNADERLNALVAICAAIGVPEVAEALTQARLDLNGPLTPAQRRQRLWALEEQLFRIDAPMDHAIGSFARGISPVPIACASWEMSSALSGDAI
jgi:hypothetical protein